MKRRFLLIVSVLMIVPFFAGAQYNIDVHTALVLPTPVTDPVPDSEPVITKSYLPKVVTAAEQKYLHKLKVREHNYFETANAFTLSQYQYNNWAEGGINSFNAKATSLNKHVYTHSRMTVDSYLNAVYGVSFQDGLQIKTDDSFEINSNISYKIWRKWSYTFGLNLKSQFSRTYNADRTDYASAFFAPANLKPYAGILYTYDANRTIMLAPLAGNMLFVCNKKLRDAGAFGITPGKWFQPNIGIYVNIQWMEKLTKDGSLRYKTNLQSFYDYKFLPNLYWENWLDYKFKTYFTVGFYIKVVYDRKVNQAPANPWQFKESFGIGLTYAFKNK